MHLEVLTPFHPRWDLNIIPHQYSFLHLAGDQGAFPLRPPTPPHIKDACTYSCYKPSPTVNMNMEKKCSQALREVFCLIRQNGDQDLNYHPAKHFEQRLHNAWPYVLDHWPSYYEPINSKHQHLSPPPPGI